MTTNCVIVYIFVIILASVHFSFAEKPLFYIYELDEEYWWRWPVAEANCTTKGYVGHEHAQLSGIGRPIKPDDGLFLTWHFSMFSSLFNRYKRSSRRTYDPEKASMFIIPYDLGLDGYLNRLTCHDRMRCTPGLATRLMDYLSKSKYFQRYQGADHVVLWSLGQYHPWPHNQCDVFMKTFCVRCTFTCYWMDPVKADNRFVSLPFPSSYHYWDGIKTIPWVISPTSTQLRTMKVVYLGSTHTLNPAHTKIRRAMTAQCIQHPNDCHWKRIGHTSTDTQLSEALELYRHATFCLCPPGDDPARKALSDMIVSGCIPIIFEKASLYNQYPWNIGENNAKDISIYIPGHAIRSNTIQLMDVINAISNDTIRLKQLAIQKIAPQVQYAVPPLESLQNKYDNTTWDPPFIDGAEAALNGMFTRIDAVLHNRSTDIPSLHMLKPSWNEQFNKVIIQIPNDTTLSTTDTTVYSERIKNTSFKEDKQNRDTSSHVRKRKHKKSHSQSNSD